MTIMNGGPLRILIVDDEPDIVETLADGLEMSGEITYPAHDAAAALRLTEEFAPDVALLDIGLPDIDGFELARRLHARHGKQLVLIAVTAYGDDHHKMEARRVGFDAFLVKPVRIEAVRNEIRRLIGQRHATGQRPTPS